MEALLQLEAKEAIPTIIPLLKDNESTVRMAALNTLSELRAKGAASGITELLKDNDAIYVFGHGSTGLVARKEALPGLFLF